MKTEIHRIIILTTERYSGAVWVAGATFTIVAFVGSCVQPAPRTHDVPIARFKESIETVTLRTSRVHLGEATAARPWEMRIEASGNWTLALFGPGGKVERISRTNVSGTAKILTIIDERKLLEIPSGSFGTGIPDYPVKRIEIKTNRRLMEYKVGALRIIDPSELDPPVRLMEAWCQLIDELQLPSNAIAPSAWARDQIALFRRKSEAYHSAESVNRSGRAVEH